MFGWIPVIGPIIDGIVHIFNKYEDTQLGKYKVDGTVDVAGMKASADIIASTKDDIGVRLARDLLLFPVIIWTDLIVWDKIVAIHYPHLVYGVALLPDAISYLPYAAVTFLLGNVGLIAWRRR